MTWKPGQVARVRERGWLAARLEGRIVEVVKADRVDVWVRFSSGYVTRLALDALEPIPEGGQ